MVAGNQRKVLGYVSEVLIYDSQISTAERISVEPSHSKYRLLDHHEHSLPELNVPGGTILYTTATRPIIVLSRLGN